VRSLVALGYRISRDNSAGYCLEATSPRLLPAEIARHLRTERIGKVVHHFESIDSTNRHAMQIARQGAREGEVVVAETQSAAAAASAARFLACRRQLLRLDRAATEHSSGARPADHARRWPGGRRRGGAARGYPSWAQMAE